MRMVPARIAAAVVIVVAAAGCSKPAPVAKKSYAFHGKVEAVDKNKKNLLVNGEAVEGWMGAMTMEYKVDDPAILDTLKPGDQIHATVYDDDEVLHAVEIAKSKQ